MQNKKSSVLRNVAIVLLVAGALVYLVIYALRPIAKVARVTHDIAVMQVPASVDVFAEYQMDLKSEAAGRILKDDLPIGRHVSEGDFLAQIDTADLDLEIDKAKVDIDALKRRKEIGSTSKTTLENAQ